MAEARNAVNWTEYFESIKIVCPWSTSAWKNNAIDVVRWQRQIFALGEYQARVYVVDLNPRRLKKLADKLEANSEEDEWLWSHPRYKGHSAPLPILIQQSRAQLEQIRTKTSRA